jgi:hypothetical protein
MLRSTTDTQHPRKWADALRREMQMAIGQQLRVELELPRKLAPGLGTLFADKDTDKEHDPYADIVGTC